MLTLNFFSTVTFLYREMTALKGLKNMAVLKGLKGHDGTEGVKGT